MKKNIIILILSAFVITSCGYKSIYSSKNLDFNIIEFEVGDKTKISRKIKNNLDSYKKNDSNNFYSIKINSKKEINIISKDSEGDPSNFEMTIISEITILNDKKVVENKVFSESFNYKNSSNKFDLKEYEKNIEDNLTNKILESIISYFYTL